MQSAGGLSSHKEILHIGFRIRVDFHPAVLIVQRRIDQDRILADIDPEPFELQHHCWKMFLNRPRSMLGIQERRIQPHPDTTRHGANPTTFLALPND